MKDEVLIAEYEGDEECDECDSENEDGESKDGEFYEECYVSDHCPSLYNCVDNKCVHKPLLPLTL